MLLCRSHVLLPEVNSTTFNPWIQPYSYATATVRSNLQNTYSDGVLVQPLLHTTLSPIITTPKETPSLSKHPSTIAPSEHTIKGLVTDQLPRSDTAKYKDEFLFPPERFKIVEENLFYETSVRTCT